MGAKVEHDAKTALDGLQALDEVMGNGREQEFVCVRPCRRAIAPYREQAPVEDVMGGGHAANVVVRRSVFNTYRPVREGRRSSSV